MLVSQTHILQAGETLGATQRANHATPAHATADVNAWPSEVLKLGRNRQTLVNM